MNSTRLLVTVKLMFSRQLVSPHQESGDKYDQGPLLLRLKSIHAHVGVDMEEGITTFPLKEKQNYYYNTQSIFYAPLK